MLKIKDNVDLKELEKFGFKYNNDLQMYYKNEKSTTWSARLFADNRKIEIVTTVFCNLGSLLKGLDNLIFDLIQAGLVEKVGGQKCN